VPELPELEICRRQLTRWGSGKVLSEVKIPDPSSIRRTLSSRPSDADPSGPERLDALLGRTPAEAIRHGKRVGWRFGDDAILIHLGMTGKWVRRGASEDPPRHGRIGLTFDERTLWLIDPRRFGCVCVIAADELELALRGNMGPDALLEPLDGPGLKRRFRGRRAIKVALLDQTTIAGIGNIQAIEALFRARIAPTTPIDAMTTAQWNRLAIGLLVQLQWTIDKSDAEEIVYSSDAGATHPFRIYGREGEDCPTCTTAIHKEVLGGRSTFWCPTCQ
jgi:formamidopyrimidine-DNA glycosylase